MSTNKRCFYCGKELIHFLDTANGNRGLCQLCLLQDNLRAKREAFNKETVKQDMVNHPPHYKQGGVECIEAIKSALTPEEFRGYCKGNVIKYVWRERHKGGDESLQKADWYMGKMIDE